MGYNFDYAFKNITKEVVFDSSWSNGTGYYDGAITAKLGLKPGERAKATSPMPNNRRLILVGTRFGNAVFFDRYTQGSGSADVCVSNVPDELRPFVPSGRIGEDDQARLFMYEGSMNIGADIEKLFSSSSTTRTKHMVQEGVIAMEKTVAAA